MLETVIQFVHLLSLVCWIGSIVFFSFFAAPAVFRVLDRPSAGELVGAIFPKYYLIGYVCGLLAMGTLLLGSNHISTSKTGFLLTMILCTFFSGLIIQPRARELKHKIKSVDSDEVRKPLEVRFQRLHAISVLLNSIVLFAGVGLLWLTAQGLQL